MDLFPRPRSLELLGGDPVVVHGQPVVVTEPSVPSEGFVLTVDDGRAVLAAADQRGERYGLALLAQLRRGYGDALPRMVVRDHPDVAVRAFMLDISRDRVPTMATLHRLVDVLALARYNQLQLYMEHTFAYRDHELVWRDASPITAEELRALDDRCAAAGIELVANQNCLGHMGRWLRHEPYRHRAAWPDGFPLLPGVRLPPETLAPTEDNAAFVRGLLGELLPNLRSGQVHIGFDEPIGLGIGEDGVDHAELAAAFARFLRMVSGPLLADGRTVQVWGDVFGRHPELLDTLPGGMVVIPWSYDAPGSRAHVQIGPRRAQALARLGIDLTGPDDFASICRPFAASDRPFWVAPGTSTWTSLVGRVDNARANLRDAVVAGRAAGARGVLVTDWGDHGHHQPPSVSYGPLLEGGALAWCADANTGVDMAAVLDDHVFADGARVLGGVLEELGLQWARTGRGSLNSSPLSAALLPGVTHLVWGDTDRDAVRNVVEVIDRSLDLVDAAAPACADGAVVVAEVRAAARLARHGALRMLGDERPEDAWMRADLADARQQQRAAWLASSRPGGLADSIARLDVAMADYGADAAS